MPNQRNSVRAWIQTASNVQGVVDPNVQLSRLLAEGGQGVVYLGSVHGSDAAIKIYFPGQHSRRIEREVLALQRLSSPNIVRLLWSGDAPTPFGILPVVATEFVKGVSVAERIQGGAVAAVEAAALGRDVASAIHEMWQLRIVHRDLKPSNVLISTGGSACVIDLGLARHLDQSSLTALGTTWGTYGYLSPEQARAVRQLTCKSDIFALGVLLVEALCGYHPSNGDQARLLSSQFHLNLPPRARKVGYAGLLARLLHPRPAARPAPHIVAYELSTWLSQQP